MDSDAKHPNDVSAADLPPGRVWAMRIKFVAFSLILALMLLSGLELVVRLSRWDRETMHAPLLPLVNKGFESVHQSDPLLFYSLRPNATGRFNQVTVTTNSLGLRSREIGPKQPGEFRILSLGESSAFGAGVESKDTFVERLEHRLNEVARDEKYTVINAGVSAYSSFQSRIYLEHRGLLLQPDVVLIYHELADFLPTTNREALAPDRLGLPLSDKELFESQSQNFNRRLLEWSALYRLINRLSTEYRIDRLQRLDDTASAEHINVPSALKNVSTPEGVRELNLPARVPLPDRRENLATMLALCKSAGAQLVVLHPSYSESERHDCDLTEFCREYNVPMFDVYDCLHPAGAPAGAMYWDLWHPNAQGHASIAEGIFNFLMAERLVPAARAESSAVPAAN